MHKYKYIIVVSIVLFLLPGSVLFFGKNMREDGRKRAGDHIISNFQSALAYEMVNLLSFSLALSENNALKNALKNDDEHQGHVILSSTSDRFKQYTHLKSLHLQVLTPDFFVFARSWDEGFEGMPLSWFRDDLEQLKKSREPKVGMETGRLLSFKATIPIKNSDEIVGYLEAIHFVDTFAKKLQKRNIDLFVLMDAKYLDKASLMISNMQLNGYVIANKNYNQRLFSQAAHVDWKQLVEEGYYHQNAILYLLEPMYNGNRDKIGYYLLAISDKSLKNHYDSDEKTHFFTQFADDDIYAVVESWHDKHGSYANGGDRGLMELLPHLKKDDRVDLEKEATAKLQKYKKGDLVNIILNKRYQEPKRGEIR